MKQVLAKVISNSEVIPGVYLIWLQSPQIASMALPGQFVMVRCGGDTVVPRPLSVHRVDGDSLALLFSVVGKGTTWLSQRKKGFFLTSVNKLKQTEFDVLNNLREEIR